MKRKHNASLPHRVIDSGRQLINQMQQKREAAQKGVLGWGGGRWGGCQGLQAAEREEDVSGMCEQMLAHRGKRETSLA